MNFEIVPGRGVGPITFGMTREALREVLAVPVEPSLKSIAAAPADFFKSLGLFVDYKPPGLCEAIEFNGPASPTFKGKPFLGTSYIDIEDWVRTIDPDIVLNDAGFKSRRLGFGVYAECARRIPDCPIEAVIVFDKDYYPDKPGTPGSPHARVDGH